MSPTVVARYDYCDENGKLLYQVERLQTEKGKGFRQRRPCDECQDAPKACTKCKSRGWLYSLDDTRRVPYRLPELLEAKGQGKVISAVEGEKDADTLVARGHVATTCPGGAGKWREEYNEYFKDAKVAVISDNDEVGQKHALSVACALDPIVEKLWVFQPSEECKDITEHLEAGKTMKELRSFEWRSRVGPEREQSPIRVISVRELMATPDPKEEDKLWGPALMRGSRMIVAAFNGHGKSSFSMWLISSIIGAKEFLGWSGQGDCRALVLDVEQGRWTLKHRFSEAGLDAWPDRIDLVHAPDGLSLDADQRQCDELEKIFRKGRYDVVLADPLYKLHRTTTNDERNAVDLMRKFDAWRAAYGFALIMPMHCRKPQGAATGFDLADISGVAALGQGAEIIIGLERKSQGYTHLHWWKDRDGYTDCLMERWGLMFDRETGFKRDPRDLEDEEVVLREKVRAALTATPGLLRDDVALDIGTSAKRAERLMESLGCRNDGARYKKDQRWFMPAELFDSSELARWNQEEGS